MPVFNETENNMEVTKMSHKTYVPKFGEMLSVLILIFLTIASLTLTIFALMLPSINGWSIFTVIECTLFMFFFGVLSYREFMRVINKPPKKWLDENWEDGEYNHGKFYLLMIRESLRYSFLIIITIGAMIFASAAALYRWYFVPALIFIPAGGIVIRWLFLELRYSIRRLSVGGVA
jgi:hypothetical protein